MEKNTKKLRVVGKEEVSLGELIHRQVRIAIEAAVEGELEAALGARKSERVATRAGYRNGSKPRTLTGPTGPVELMVPRATLFDDDGAKAEWRSTLVPRYGRRIREVNEAIAGAYLMGGNTRRIRGALRPLLKDAPLSRSSVSRVVATLKGEMEAWRTQSLAGLDVLYAYLDAIALRVRAGGKVTSIPVLAAVAVLLDGSKRLVDLEACGSESHDAWKGFLDALVARGLKAPRLCVVDGNAGLQGAVELVWKGVPIQRCTVHKLRNLTRKAPPTLHEEIKDDYHAIVYADDRRAAEAARKAFLTKWDKRCAGVARSLREAGDELLTFYGFPMEQWKSLRSTNVIERLNGEFRRRVKTQCSFPTEDSAIVLLFSLVASGQITLRRLDGYTKNVEVVAHPRKLLAVA